MMVLMVGLASCRGKRALVRQVDCYIDVGGGGGGGGDNDDGDDEDIVIKHQ